MTVRVIVMAAVMALGVIGATARVAAKRVVFEPQPVRGCRTAKTWSLVETCLARHGKVSIERQAPGARLVRLKSADDQQLVLFIERDGSWWLTGLLNGQHGSAAVSGMERYSRDGWRIDTSLTVDGEFMIDGAVKPATLRQAVTSYCPGNHYRCRDAITRCSLTVDGVVRALFEGKLRRVGEEVFIDGDRSAATDTCFAATSINIL